MSLRCTAAAVLCAVALVCLLATFAEAAQESNSGSSAHVASLSADHHSSSGIHSDEDSHDHISTDLHSGEDSHDHISTDLHSGEDSHDDHDHDDHDHDDHAEDADEEALARNLKVMSLCVLFAASIVLAAVVIFLPSCHANKLILSLGAAFSAGVFLTVGLTHMLGEATMILLSHYGEADSEHYRHPFVVATAGYLVMVLIQRGLFSDAHAAVHNHQFHVHPSKKRTAAEAEPIADSPPAASLEGGKGEDTDSCTSTIEVVATLGNVARGTNADGSASKTVGDSTGKLNEEGEEGTDEKDHQHVGGATVAATMLALCIHSLLEGMALGLQSTKEGVLLLFIAIITHQWAEDFSVSVSTGRAQLPKLHRIVISLVLAAACPLGIGIGWWLQSAVPSVVTGYLLAFSTGCFISIACTELIPDEISGGLRKSWRQLIAVVCGSGLLYMVMVLMYKKEAHNH